MIRRKYAKESLEINCKDTTFIELFPDIYEIYKNIKKKEQDLFNAKLVALQTLEKLTTRTGSISGNGNGTSSGSGNDKSGIDVGTATALASKTKDKDSNVEGGEGLWEYAVVLLVLIGCVYVAVQTIM